MYILVYVCIFIQCYLYRGGSGKSGEKSLFLGVLCCGNGEGWRILWGGVMYIFCIKWCILCILFMFYSFWKIGLFFQVLSIVIFLPVKKGLTFSGGEGGRGGAGLAAQHKKPLENNLKKLSCFKYLEYRAYLQIFEGIFSQFWG